MDSKKINIPSIEECHAFWDEYATPFHVRDHMRAVATVGKHLATKLNEAGESVIVDLVERACLLHDTVRVTEWDTLSLDNFPYVPTQKEIQIWEEQRKKYPSEISHAQVNYEIFYDRYPEMAELILIHSISSTPHLKTWEEKLVNYADRRVGHHTIMSAKDRLEEAFARYSRTTQRPLEREPEIVDSIFNIEQEIFTLIGEVPDSINSLATGIQ